MPKTDRTRTRKTPAETATGSAGYAINTSGGIRKSQGKASRDESLLLELAETVAARDAAESDAEDVRAEMSDDDTPASPIPGKRGDGVFRISFIKMGKGDCTIMCTPAGKIILIDCGSSDHEEDNQAFAARVKGELQSTDYLRNAMDIDIVILTHSDVDHWGQLEPLLDGFTVLTAYFSGRIGNYGGGGRWLQNNAIADANVKPVVLSKDGSIGANTLAGAPIPLAPPAAKGAQLLEKLDADVGLVVVAEDDCRVTLLAAGVTHPYVPDNEGQDSKNRGSIVTLVEVSDRTFLISGDATKATEAFLLRSSARAARIAGVHVVQAAHHGSDVTSSSPAWVNHLKPVEQVIVSTTKVGAKSYSLPRAPIIRRYLQRFTTNGRAADATTHPISTWDLATSKDAPIELDADQPVYTTGSSGTQTITVP